MQLVPITTDDVSSNPAKGEVYNIMWYSLLVTCYVMSVVYSKQFLKVLIILTSIDLRPLKKKPKDVCANLVSNCQLTMCYQQVLLCLIVRRHIDLDAMKHVVVLFGSK